MHAPLCVFVFLPVLGGRGICECMCLCVPVFFVFFLCVCVCVCVCVFYFCVSVGACMCFYAHVCVFCVCVVGGEVWGVGVVCAAIVNLLIVCMYVHACVCVCACVVCVWMCCVCVHVLSIVQGPKKCCCQQVHLYVLVLHRPCTPATTATWRRIVPAPCRTRSSGGQFRTGSCRGWCPPLEVGALGALPPGQTRMRRLPWRGVLEEAANWRVPQNGPFAWTLVPPRWHTGRVVVVVVVCVCMHAYVCMGLLVCLTDCQQLSVLWLICWLISSTALSCALK